MMDNTHFERTQDRLNMIFNNLKMARESYNTDLQPHLDSYIGRRMTRAQNESLYNVIRDFLAAHNLDYVKFDVVEDKTNNRLIIAGMTLNDVLVLKAISE